MNYKDLPIVPFILATSLSAHGLRKKSLSPSGAIAAFVVGFLMMHTRLRVFGVSLIVFYLVGSRATKVGKNIKSHLEEGHHEAGYRTAWQVLCNSLSAFVASIIWQSLFHDASLKISPNNLGIIIKRYDASSWCAFDAADSIWSRRLVLAALGCV